MCFGCKIQFRSHLEFAEGSHEFAWTRIPVWTLVAYRKLGAPDEELLANYPGLTTTDLGVAWDYYEQNREQVDREIAQADLI